MRCGVLMAAAIGLACSGCSMRELGAGAAEAVADRLGDRFAAVLEDNLAAAASRAPAPAITPANDREQRVYDLWAVIGALLLGNGAVLADRRWFHRRNGQQGK